MNRTTIAALHLVAGAITLANPAWADHGAAGTGPESSGPIVGSSARTTAKGKAAISLNLTLNLPDNRGDTALAGLAQQGVDAHDQARSETYTLSAAYGVTDDLTLSVSLPVVRRIDIREGELETVGTITTASVAARGTSSGFGDAALVGKWRFTGEHHHGWEAALLLGIKLPSGVASRIDARGDRFETEHQPGTGSWDPLIGLALTRPMPWGSFGASATWQMSGPGSQDTTLGDRAQFAAGLSYRLAGPKIDYHGHQHESKGAVSLDGVLELNGEWEGQQQIGGVIDPDSGGRALFLSPGLRVSAGTWSFTLGASLPLAQHIRASHPDTHFRLRFGVTGAF